MTIKSLDYQVLLPKTQEVAQQLHNLRQHDQVNQQHLAQQAQREQAEARTKIKHAAKTEQEKVREKEERERKNKQDQMGSHKAREKSKKKSGKHAANLGNKLDITI